MIGIYVHIPFCRRKCPYCDFYSVSEEAEALALYPELLRQQVSLAGKEWAGPVSTVFFGGGTPSLLPPEAVGKILARIDARFGIAEGAEISLEANPGTVTPATLAGYRAGGVNRLSLGIQSLDDTQLQTLGRLHTAAEARKAVAWARRAGFDNLACDLMFALPGQTPDGLATEIRDFLALGPEHLSCYGLSIEEGTLFYDRYRQGGLRLPDEELYRQFFLHLHSALEEAGYRHYEISNYALPGRDCRHNLAYWRRRSCLGLGAGAHSFLDRHGGERRAVPADVPAYAAALAAGCNPAQVLETFDRGGAMAETLYLGLRTAEGVDEAEFRVRFGQGVADAFPAAVSRAGARLVQTAGAWHFDLEGWLLFDHLIALFL